MSAFIKENIVYPEEAINQEIEGKIFLKFRVNEKGIAENPEIVKGIGLEDAFMRSINDVFSKMPKWKPGMENDKHVPTDFYWPIKFSLAEKDKRRDEAGKRF